MPPQEPLLPAGLPIHLPLSTCASDSALLTIVRISKLYLLTYLQSVHLFQYTNPLTYHRIFYTLFKMSCFVNVTTRFWAVLGD